MINKLKKALIEWCIVNKVYIDDIAFYEDIITEEFYIWDCNINGKQLHVKYNKLNGGITIEY